MVDASLNGGGFLGWLRTSFPLPPCTSTGSLRCIHCGSFYLIYLADIPINSCIIYVFSVFHNILLLFFCNFCIVCSDRHSYFNCCYFSPLFFISTSRIPSALLIFT